MSAKEVFSPSAVGFASLFSRKFRRVGTAHQQLRVNCRTVVGSANPTCCRRVWQCFYWAVHQRLGGRSFNASLRNSFIRSFHACLSSVGWAPPTNDCESTVDPWWAVPTLLASPDAIAGLSRSVSSGRCIKASQADLSMRVCGTRSNAVSRPV